MGPEQSCPPPDSPRLCANGCGFYGTAATMNLCSKCYRNFLIKEVTNKPSDPAEITKEAITSTGRSVNSPPSSETMDLNVRNHCSFCNRRLRLMRFDCRCGSTFCSKHRYPEEHDCTFDFKTAGKCAIAEANPIVKADKLQGI